MSFSTLQSLMTLSEDVASQTGPKSHPSLTHAEIVRFDDKISQAQAKVEELEAIFKHAPGATGTAHKLHHIGVKSGADMSALDAVQKKINELADAIDELHQMWGTDMMGATDAFGDDEPGVAPEGDESYRRDDAPADDADMEEKDK